MELPSRSKRSGRSDDTTSSLKTKASRKDDRSSSYAAGAPEPPKPRQSRASLAAAAGVDRDEVGSAAGSERKTYYDPYEELDDEIDG